MKRTVLLLALLPLLAGAQVVVPLPPPSEDERVAVVVELPSARDRVMRFTQLRTDENRDRNNQRPSEPRPPGAPNPPPPPGERGGSFGGGSGKGDPAYSMNARGFVTQRDGRSRTPPIIVSGHTLDPKERAAAEEDLGIMARLIEKEIERETGVSSPPSALGIPIFTRFEGRSSTMLLEGYGAVFTFNVRMPLTPPPARAPEKKQDRPTDSPWERTRREMFGSSDEGGRRGGSPEGQTMRFDYKPPAGVSGGLGGMTGLSGSGVMTGTFNRRDEQPQYDAKKVEELKKSILEALKQAGNIRALKADDYLTVIVQGSGGGGFDLKEIAVEMHTTTSSGSGGPPHTETFVNRGESGSSPRSGTLTVRAKKSDCEDFAKGKLTAEQFGKKALVNLQ